MTTSAAYNHELNETIYQHNTFAIVLSQLQGEPFRQQLEQHEGYIRDVCDGNRDECGRSIECSICGLFAPCRNELHYHHDGCPTCNQ